VLFQVSQSRPEQAWLILEEPQGEVAALAKEAARRARAVIVIGGEMAPVLIPLAITTNTALEGSEVTIAIGGPLECSAKTIAGRHDSYHMRDDGQRPRRPLLPLPLAQTTIGHWEPF